MPRTEKLLLVKDGDVVRYHPITTSPDHVIVKITGEPYQLGDGDWIVRAENIVTGRIHRPYLGALTPNIGPAVAPQKEKRKRQKNL